MVVEPPTYGHGVAKKGSLANGHVLNSRYSGTVAFDLEFLALPSFNSIIRVDMGTAGALLHVGTWSYLLVR